VTVDDRGPLAGILAANEVLLHRVWVRMMLRKLDSKLAHVPAGTPRTMNHFTESIVR